MALCDVWGVWRAEVLCLMLLVSCSAQAQVNRCVGADGRVEYRAQACQSNASGTALSIGTAPRPVALPASFGPVKRLEATPIVRSVTTQAGNPQFGKPIRPLELPQHKLSTETPPRELAAGAEIALVSGYESSSPVTRVVVNRPGKQVLLILSSYSKVLWRIDVIPGTTIKGVLVSSHENQSGLSTDPEVRGYKVRLPYAYDVENAQFTQLLSELHALFGTSKIDMHKGGYSLPTSLELNAPDAPRAALTLAGEQAQVTANVFDFDLLSDDFSKVPFRNTGPAIKMTGKSALITDGRVALSGSTRQIYSLANDMLWVKDRDSGQSKIIPLPTSFPSFSWPTDLAYDTQQDIVSVVTLGGEGFLYRYDAKRRQWIDYRSLNNLDVTSLSYDPQSKRYVAWTSDGELLFISNQGVAQSSKSLHKQMRGLGRLYDRNNGSPPRLFLAPRGHMVALLYATSDKVTHIWTYDEKSGAVQLTYKDGEIKP